MLIDQCRQLRDGLDALSAVYHQVVLADDTLSVHDKCTPLLLLNEARQAVDLLCLLSAGEISHEGASNRWLDHIQACAPLLDESEGGHTD
jgi:hypothetical protein